MNKHLHSVIPVIFSALIVWAGSQSNGANASAAPAPQGQAAQQPAGGAPAVPQSIREYQLKGAFLRYVAKYVGFPASSFEGNTINLCVLGQVPYFEGIESINGKVVNDRAIQVSKVLSADDAKSSHCQIVFVARTETDNMAAIIAAFEGSPILGFGDIETFAQAGGEMNFYIANNHLAIMTNMPAVEAAKLTIDPQMLKLVTFVPQPKAASTPAPAAAAAPTSKSAPTPAPAAAPKTAPTPAAK